MLTATTLEATVQARLADTCAIDPTYLRATSANGHPSLFADVEFSNSTSVS